MEDNEPPDDPDFDPLHLYAKEEAAALGDGMYRGRPNSIAVVSITGWVEKIWPHDMFNQKMVRIVLSYSIQSGYERFSENEDAGWTQNKVHCYWYMKPGAYHNFVHKGDFIFVIGSLRSHSDEKWKTSNAAIVVRHLQVLKSNFNQRGS